MILSMNGKKVKGVLTVFLSFHFLPSNTTDITDPLSEYIRGSWFYKGCLSCGPSTTGKDMGCFQGTSKNSRNILVNMLYFW